MVFPKLPLPMEFLWGGTYSSSSSSSSFTFSDSVSFDSAEGFDFNASVASFLEGEAFPGFWGDYLLSDELEVAPEELDSFYADWISLLYLSELSISKSWSSSSGSSADSDDSSLL